MQPAMATQPTPMLSRESTQTLLRVVIVAMVLGPLSTVALLGSAMPDSTVNVVGPLMMITVALTGWVALKFGRIAATINILGCGACLALAGIAVFTGGVRSPVIIVFPIVILIYGWLMQGRGVVVSTLLITTLTIALEYAHWVDILPQSALPPAPIYLVHALTIYALAALLMAFILRAFNQQLATLDAVGSELAKRSKLLEQNSQLLERAQAVAHVGSWVGDIPHDVITPSPQGCEIFGCRNGDTLHYHEYLNRVHPEERNAVAEAWALAMRNKRPFDSEHRLLVDGKVRWVRQKAEIEFDANAHPIRTLGIVMDITEHKQMEHEIRQLAFFDTLTQLPNRRLFNDRLNQVLSANKRSGAFGALMFLDLDNFKPLNDRHGHASGDLLLIEVANRLRHCVREMDTVARFGGDEFVVLLSELDTDLEKARTYADTVAHKISAALAAPYVLTIDNAGTSEPIEHLCTASVGVVVFSSTNSTAHALIERADATMYCAKNQGRNCVCFTVHADTPSA